MNPRLSAPSLFSAFSLVATSVVVVLILAVWVGTPMCCCGRPVLLPVTLAPPLAPESPNDLLVSLEADGNIFIDTRWFPLPDFQAKMRELAARNSKKRIVLKADRRLNFREVRSLLGTISSSGYRRILLAVETRDFNPLRLPWG